MPSNLLVFWRPIHFSGISEGEMLELGTSEVLCEFWRRMRSRLCLPLLVSWLGLLSYTATGPLTSISQPHFQNVGVERRRADRGPIELSSGARVEFSSFLSSCLKEEREYSIFLPPSYGKSNLHYPVVYFLHGLNNDHTSWTVDRYGHIHEQVDKLIAEKTIPEILMVHPKGDNSFYTNYADGSRNYEDFVTSELIAYVEKTYRAKPGGRWRAIGGTSMGGFGALKIAFKRKDLYAATAAHSPIVFLVDPAQMSDETKSSGRFEWFTRMITPMFGNPIDIVRWQANNPLDLAKKADLNGLRIYFDYGTADRYNQSIGLGQGVKSLGAVLTQRQIAHVFKEYPNEPHGWELVSLHISESLPFLCESFR
jgi:S-formylglutathione hydrolase FrmB